MNPTYLVAAFWVGFLIYPSVYPSKEEKTSHISPNSFRASIYDTIYDYKPNKTFLNKLTHDTENEAPNK